MEIWPTDENCKMEASCHPSISTLVSMSNLLLRASSKQEDNYKQPMHKLKLVLVYLVSPH